MALYPSDYGHMYYSSPMERMMARVFNDTVRDFDRSLRSVAPYWLNQPMLHECNIGNAVSKLVNDPEKFGVEVDVSQFHPEELSVNVRDKELVVEGHHEERCDQSGSIERHFIRKYAIPEDVNLESVESHLSDKGILSVCAKKMHVEGKNVRKIPIQAAPRGNHQAAEHRKEAPPAEKK